MGSSDMRRCPLSLLLVGLVAIEAGAADRCAALLQRDFTVLPDAATTVIRATLVAAANGVPAHCTVEGRVAPAVNFSMQLPVPAEWNRRLLMQGCGGMCGAAQPATCEDALARRYATVTTDMGHQGAAWEAEWARDNLAAEIDFAYRATHVAAVAAQALVTAYYGEVAERRYFRGCSTGGRQGLVAAQRFPADFDGIIAGAPVLSQTGVTALHLIWSGRANLDADGKPLLGPADVERLHAAVLARCGNALGVIPNPARCDFDPAVLLCARAADTGCLNSNQVAAARRLYAGARDSAGRPLTPGGLAPGSEREWVPYFVGSDGPATFHPAGAVSVLYRNLIFMPDAPATASAADFDFDRDPPRLALMESLYTPQNPDLGTYAARDGKLILYHGWNDAEIPPAWMLDWFARVEQTMGGAERTASFARLFMLPGVAHCRRGPGADAIDWLTVLERWVEQGEDPDTVEAFHLAVPENYLGLPRKRFPLTAVEFDRVEIVRPWEVSARAPAPLRPR